MTYTNSNIVDFLYEFNDKIIEEKQIVGVLDLTNLLLITVKIPVNKKTHFTTTEIIDVEKFDSFLLKRRIDKINKIRNHANTRTTTKSC